MQVNTEVFMYHVYLFLGYVYDYDGKGLHQKSIWPECLVVISNTSMEPVLWDRMLQCTCRQSDLWLEHK